MVGRVLFVVCLVARLLYYEVMLRVRVRLGPTTAFRFVSGFQHRAARGVLGLARVWGGFRTEYHRFAGTLPTQCVVLSNHQSLADIPVLMEALPELDLRFVAKRELRRFVPAASLTLREGRHALIGRKSGSRRALRALRDLAGLARWGISPAVFPEGTRSRTGEVGVFQSAAVRTLAESTALPILSVAVDGGLEIARFSGVIKNIGRARYRVRPLTLYPPATTRAEVARTLTLAREEIAAQIDRWRAAPPAPTATRTPPARAVGYPAR